MRLRTKGKRVLSLVLCVMFVLSSMVFTVSAEEEVKTAKNYDVPKAAAPITVDGIIDADEWKNSLEIDVKADLVRWMQLGENTLQGGTIRMIWDEENLYLAMDIKDPVKGKSTNRDGIEFLLYNSATDEYGAGAKFDIKADYYGTGKVYVYEDNEDTSTTRPAMGQLNENHGVVAASSDYYSVENPEGYTIEMQMPWTFFAKLVTFGAIANVYEGKADTKIYAQINVWDEGSEGGQDWYIMDNGLYTGEDFGRYRGANASTFTLVDKAAGTAKTTADGPYFIPKTETAPVLDGEIDFEEEWNSAAEVSMKTKDLTWDGGKEKKDDNGDSFALMMWDKDYLYVAYEIGDTTASIIKEDVNSNIYSDEVRMNFTSASRMLTLIPEISSTHEAASVWSVTGVEGEKLAATRDGSGYRIEAAIPWSAINVESAFGAEFNMNNIVVDADENGAIVNGFGYTGEGGDIDTASDKYILTNASAGIAVEVIPDNQHNVPTTKAEINLDGDIEADEWENAAVLDWKADTKFAKFPEGDVILTGPDADHEFNVITRMMWDENHLYLSYDVTDYTPSASDFVGFMIFGQDAKAGLERDILDLRINMTEDGVVLGGDSLLLNEKATDYYRAAGSYKTVGEGADEVITGYTVEVELDWKIFEALVAAKKEVAGKTFFYTGNYAGRAGTKMPIQFHAQDHYQYTKTEMVETDGVSKETEVEVNGYGWYQYHTDTKTSAWAPAGANSDLFLCTEDVAGRPEGYKPPEHTEIVEAPKNRYDIPKTDALDSSKFDGVIGDEWAGALVLDLSNSEDNKAFASILHGNDASLGDTKVYLLWDDKNLYIAYDVKDATDTGSYAGRGGSTSDYNDHVQLYFFGDKSSSSNSEALAFSLYPKLRDGSGNTWIGIFESNINGSSNLIGRRKMPSASSIMKTGTEAGADYNFQFEFAIPWEYFKELHDAGVKNGNFKFTNYPTGVAGTVFTMCAGYMDSRKPQPYQEGDENYDPADPDKLDGGATTWVWHSYYGAKSFPFKYSTMDQFRLYDKSLDDHELTHYDAVEPTCTTGGNVEYWVCAESHCGKTFVEVDGEMKEAVATSVMRSALGHDYQITHDETSHWSECTRCSEINGEKEAHTFGEYVVTKEPQIGVPGEKERTCDICGYKETAPIDPLVEGHTLKHYDAKEPTCQEDGNIEYWFCTDEGCGKYYSDNAAEHEITREETIIPKVDHSYEVKHDDDNHWEECIYCHEQINKEPHTFGEFVIEKAPHPGVPGLKAKTCQREGCGCRVEEEIEALPESKIQIEDAKGAIGKEFTTYVHLVENTGIVSLRFDIEYDTNIFELVKIEDLKALNGWTEPVDEFGSPYRLRWADALTNENNTTGENIVALTFKVKDTVEVGSYSIKITPVESYATVSKSEGKEIEWLGTEATITVEKGYMLGDVNGDGVVDGADNIMLQRYLAEWAGYDKLINMDAADINKDNAVDGADNIILQRHLAEWSDYKDLENIKR